MAMELNTTNTSFMICELKLDTSSSGWYKTMTKILNNIRGVSFSIDTQAGIARVSGTVDPNTILTVFRKAGKHVTLLRVHSESGSKRSYQSWSSFAKLVDDYKRGQYSVVAPVEKYKSKEYSAGYDSSEPAKNRSLLAITDGNAYGSYASDRKRYGSYGQIENGSVGTSTTLVSRDHFPPPQQRSGDSQCSIM